jgi:phosphatidylethanolamine N-methyltransferase
MDYRVALTSEPPYHLGQPLQVVWRACKQHSRSDWIGIYPVAANSSANVTNVSSQNRWLGVYPHEWSGDIHIASADRESRAQDAHGTLFFASTEKLPNSTGDYELRWAAPSCNDRIHTDERQIPSRWTPQRLGT